MRTFRAVLLAIVATLALLCSVASTAYADSGGRGVTAQPAATDPVDPGLPD